MATKPSPNTAFVFDAIVRDLDVTASAPDVALAAQEFALGMPSSTRPLDLCWGFAPLGIGYGPARVMTGAGVVRDTSIHQFLSAPSIADPASLLGTSRVQDAYAFGSVFLSLQYYQAGFAPSISLPVALVGPGSPILMSRTHDLNTAMTWLRGGHIPPTPVPSGAQIELWRFVLDIEVYTPDTPANSVVSVSTVDVRRPRGWGGYAKETMSSILVPAAINFQASEGQDVTAAQAALLTLVQQWVSLKGWQPNFIDYWRSSPLALPERLHAYLAQSLGIIV